jgi:NAD(P)-dependent dehydrogenase (short-subunit alcohol dehydrogenase family)
MSSTPGPGTSDNGTGRNDTGGTGTGGSLAGQSALVTGGGSGIGLGIARRLGHDGATVVIAGRSAERLAAAQAALVADGIEADRVHTSVCDVTVEAQVAATCAATAEVGRFTMCVANAGFGSAAPFHLTPLDDWNAVIGTNLTGAFLTMKHAVVHLVANGGGSIVAVSSIAGPLTHRFMTAYCVSKAGLEMLVRQVADELGVAGVRANAVRPGLVPTDATVTLTTTDAIRDDYLAQMPLGRTGTDDDVAGLVRFLLGPESSWITGQCIGVDGGHTLRRGPDISPVMEMVLGDAVRPAGPQPA